MNQALAKLIKNKNEKIILAYGAEICDWLPYIDAGKTMQPPEAIVDRALILNALLNIYFNAPIAVIKKWIIDNGLYEKLTPQEKELLDKTNDMLSEQDKVNLYWNIESLWAFMWAGTLIEELAFDKPVADTMAALCPNLQKNENGNKFLSKMNIRPFGELFEKLDLYFRLHWFTRNCSLNNRDPGNLSLDIIMERRKALEWICDTNSDWDNMDLST